MRSSSRNDGAAAASAVASPVTDRARGLVRSIAVLAVVLGVLFHAALFMGRGLVPADGVLSAPPWAGSIQAPPSNPLLADQYRTLVPIRQFFTNEVRRGRFPLWNPHLSAGMPSLAAMNVAVLYPIDLLLTPLGPFHASGIAAFLKLLLAGVFTMLYMRRLGASAPAGLAAALVYSLSGFMIVWLGHPQVNAAVVLPLLLYFVEGLLAEPLRLQPAIGFAGAYAALLLGGHAPTAVHVTFVVSIYFLFRLVERGRRARLRRTLSGLAGMAAGAVIAAPLLLPYLEYYRLSSSALASAALDRSASHLAPATLAHFLLPFLSGAPHLGFEHLAARLGLGEIENFNERTGYVGLFTLFVVFVGILRVRTRPTLFFCALAAGSLLVVYGVPPFPALLHALPILSAINHQRLLLMVGWSAAVLAGFGLDAMLRAEPRDRPRWLALSFAAALAVALAVVWSLIGSGFSRLGGAPRAFLLGQAWIPVTGVVVAFLVTLRRFSPRALAVLAVGWIAVDLLWFAWGFNPAIPADLYYPATNAIRTLQSEASRFRVLGLATVLPPNTADVFGLDDARGVDFTTLRRYEELITGRAGDFYFFQSADRLPASFPLLNVKYTLFPERLPAAPEGFELFYDSEIAIYRNTRVLDRALIVFDHEVVADPADMLARVRSGSFDPSRSVLLEEPPAPVPQDSAPAVPGAEARIVAYEPDRVVVEARLPRPGFLLLLDNHYPGWRAFADGRERPIQRADYSFRAVALPAGSATVEFLYQPLSFRIGVAVALMMAAFLTLLWVREARRERRSNTRAT